MHQENETPPPLPRPEQLQPPPHDTSPPSAPPATTSSLTPLPDPPFEPIKPIGGEPFESYQSPNLIGPSVTYAVVGPAEWSTGLCGCFSDMPSCCMTCFCPWITFGQISELIDRGSSSCPINGLIYAILLAVFGCACMYSYFYRVRLRQQYNLKGSVCGDCCIHTCCEVCAISQEYRELKNRGFDMHYGWHANVTSQSYGAMTAPPMHTCMRR